ncbi:5-formyltetrahydrofolate cyclo-ligase [Kitasatospora cheerisanensis]|uniref:5-formyltetrahydrofolate cyclo-ligase n=1 Tax=Kitasatospora cheerisanensis KCTC 2395 TaxID=1348663 RepID=A0A066YRQ6_9ACTN|nr:5-formyltetrahydrofolate cyclo-ligase [Kitasatospora cheerisanensis]KDN83927.1 5-formyltetrahydrofolate cyclo-ligase [Kitasatospora cheerisanensis KCTC 2395]
MSADRLSNDKTALRSRLLAERRALTADQRAAAAEALAARATALVPPGGTVAAYVSVGAEPGTRPLLAALAAAGARVLLPVLLPDNDLDWAPYESEARLAPAGRGLLEPLADRLGPDAVCAADVVLLPGLAVDPRGIRLGRGGGSYDRVLARLARAGSRPLLATLLYPHELLPALPAEPHDLPVHAAVTPTGITRFI